MAKYVSIGISPDRYELLSAGDGGEALGTGSGGSNELIGTGTGGEVLGIGTGNEALGTGEGEGVIPLLALETHNDMTVDATGNLRLVYDAEAVGEHARQRLGTFKGEWFLDQTIGVDWFGQVLGFAQSRRVIAEAIVKRVMLGTPGVTGLREMSTSVNRRARGFYVDRAVLDTEFDEPVEV